MTEVCETCGQPLKEEIYERPLTGTMARELITIYRAARTDFAHIPTALGTHGGDTTKLRYWGFLEGQPGARGDGSTRNGWWRVTDAGVAFLRGARVPSHARVGRAGAFRGLTGQRISIHDALKTQFDFNTLMEMKHTATPVAEAEPISEAPRQAAMFGEEPTHNPPPAPTEAA